MASLDKYQFICTVGRAIEEILLTDSQVAASRPA